MTCFAEKARRAGDRHQLDRGQRRRAFDALLALVGGSAAGDRMRFEIQPAF
jgi:hypothetical protein